MPKTSQWQETADLVARTRRVAATTYACGGHMLVPWDIYMPGDAPRYFGRPDDYADLFGFIRATAGYLAGYETAAIVGPGTSAWGPAPWANEAVQIEKEGLYVFVRAKPGNAGALVAVHLVDWSDSPSRTAVRFDVRRFFGTTGASVRLLGMPKFDAKKHAAAATTGDYSALKEWTQVEVRREGSSMEVSVPPLYPSGILVVEKADD
jgi:hypothetical protein